MRRYNGHGLTTALLALAIWFAPIDVFSQSGEDYRPKAGDFRLGFSTNGGSGISYLDIEDLKTTTISLGFDYFFSSNFSLGLNLAYADARLSDESGVESNKSTLWGVGLSIYAPTSDATNFVPFFSASYLSFDLGEDFDTITGFGASWCTLLR